MTPFLLLAACGGSPSGDDDDDGPDGGVATAGLDACADDGVELELLWSVDNLHGPIVAMVAAPDGTVVLATEDGAVKQWSLGTSAADAPLEGGRPSYGDPLTETGGAVAALALDAGGTVIGATTGALRRWTLATAAELDPVPLKAGALTAVAARSESDAVIADDSFGGAMRVVRLADATTGDVFTTALWGVAAVEAAGDALFTAGHDYQMAAVERRDLAAPETPTSAWDTLSVEGWTRDVAVTADGAWLAAAGDGHVVILDATDLDAGPTAVDTTVSARAAAFTASGDHVAIATDDGRVVLRSRDLATEIAAVDVPSPVAVALDPSGERLVVASGDGHLRAYTCR